jgi:YfaZ precursor
MDLPNEDTDMRAYSALVLVALSLQATNVAAADDSEGAVGELALSNDTLQLRYINNATQLAGETSQLQGTVFLSEDRDLVISAGALFPLDFRLGNLSVSIGPQIYAALLNEENNDVMAVSAGAKLRYLVLPGINLAVAGEAFYAPDILTFGSADNMTDLSARVEFGLSSRVMAFAGMRWFDIDLTEGGGKKTLQEEAFVGFGYRF